jgi:hypothetical protein
MQQPAATAEMMFIGPLESDFGILPDQRVFENMPGGAALYAAVGASIWSPSGLGIISHVGDNYPKEWLASISGHQIDVNGLLHTPGSFLMEAFFVVPSWDEFFESEPVKEYAKRNLTHPPLMMYYRPSASLDPDSSFLSFFVRQSEELLAAIRQTRYAYIAPNSLPVQQSIVNILLKLDVKKILLALPEGELTQPHLGDIRFLLRGIDFCFCSETGLRRLLDQRTENLQTLLVDLSKFGPKIVLCQRNRDGFAIYDSVAQSHFYIPTYSTNVRNPLGIGHAFCGGFLSGWRQTYNPIDAGIKGSVSSSLAADGMGAFHSWECHPLLAEARLEALKRQVCS